MKLKRKQKIATRHAKPLSGRSLSSNSYYRPKSTSLSSIKKNKKKIDENINNSKIKLPSVGRVINWAIVFVFVVLFFFATTLSSTPIVKIAEGSYKYRDISEYQQSASDLLNNSPLNKSKLLFRSKDFENGLQNRYPEISNLEAIVPLGGRDLSVSMRLSTPLAVVINGSEKGIVDSNGILISKGLDTSDLYYIRFTTPQDSFEVGSRLFTTEEINQLELLSEELGNITLNDISGTNGLVISEILFNVSDGQFEVKMKELPYFIKLSSYADGSEQVGAAKVTILRLHNDLKQPPTKYIDVRVPGRVFVL